MVVFSRRFYILAKSTSSHASSEKLDTFCNLLLKSWPKRRNMVVFSKNLQVLAKSTISYAFSHIFFKIHDFSCFLVKSGSFCNLLLKSSPKRQNADLCWTKLYSLAKSKIFHACARNEAVFATFYWKVDRNPETWWFARKSCIFCPSRRFCMLVANLSTVCNFLLKSWLKRRHMVVCSKKLQVFAKSTIFDAFSGNEALFATFCWKVDPNAETWWFAWRGFRLWRRFFMVSREMRHFLLLKSWTPKVKLHIFAKSTFCNF